MAGVIDTIRSDVPTGLDELATLGRTLHRRRADVLANFTAPRLERVDRGHRRPPQNATPQRPGFRNLINFRLRALLHSGHLAL